jgi:hypothetical protein
VVVVQRDLFVTTAWVLDDVHGVVDADCRRREFDMAPSFASGPAVLRLDADDRPVIVGRRHKTVLWREGERVCDGVRAFDSRLIVEVDRRCSRDAFIRQHVVVRGE